MWGAARHAAAWPGPEGAGLWGTPRRPPERETPMTCARTNRHAFRLRLPRLRTTTVDRLGRRRGPRPRAEMPESRARRRSAVISAESLRKTEKGFAPTRERSRDSRCR